MRDGDQLLEMVVESLGRYERYLQGDQPAVGLLWVPAAEKGKYEPRDEADLADHIARHLRRDLAGRAIVANLAVVLRRGEATRAAGLRTDILDTATLASAPGSDSTSGELVTLVIEVKGSWNRQVLKAMREQLVEGYLREHCPEGGEDFWRLRGDTIVQAVQPTAPRARRQHTASIWSAFAIVGHVDRRGL